jgi:hypothetical protein
VLDIPFTKLVSRTEQQLFSRQFRPGVDECHHILQLIPEPECPS